jgi:hypothetical protein
LGKTIKEFVLILGIKDFFQESEQNHQRICVDSWDQDFFQNLSKIIKEFVLILGINKDFVQNLSKTIKEFVLIPGIRTSSRI